MTLAASLMPHRVPVSDLPSSFEGNAWAFCFALFSLLLIVSLSLGQVLKHWVEASRETHLVKHMPGFVPNRPTAFWTPLTLYRWKVSLLYLTIIFGAIGDVAVMLAWREVSSRTIEALLAIDRVLDALTIVPFLCAFAMACWSDQAIPAQLTYPEPRPVRPPKWARVKGSVRIVATIATISMGVTLGKVWM